MRALFKVAQPFQKTAGELLFAQNTLSTHCQKLNGMWHGNVNASEAIFSGTKVGLGAYGVYEKGGKALEQVGPAVEYTKTQFLDPVSSAMRHAADTAVKNFEKAGGEYKF